jgi:cell division transport system permease protein
MNWIAPSAADRKLLPEGRSAGPMPWVLAIMMLVTVLTGAIGIAVARASNQLSGDIADKVTIQIPEGDQSARNGQIRALLAELRLVNGVTDIEPVSEEKLGELLDPWLGNIAEDTDLPLPALIDVTLVRADDRAVAELEQIAKGIAPKARVDRHSSWLASLSGLLSSLTWLAGGLVLLMAIATGAVVLLTVRSALNTHGDTISVMHFLGSTDSQIAGLFQRRIALDALLGSIAGFAVALTLLLVLGNRVSALGSDLLGQATLGWTGWLAIAALPLLGTTLAALVARWTVLRTLGKTL